MTLLTAVIPDTDRLIVETLADDGTYDLPVGAIGYGTISFGDQAEWGMFFVASDGSVEIGISKDANLVNTDTDTKYCIFDNGTNVRIKNRSGGALTMRLVFFYG